MSYKIIFLIIVRLHIQSVRMLRRVWRYQKGNQNPYI
jgi:hypothetical protein